MHQAPSKYAPAGYISSIAQSRGLVDKILGCDYHPSNDLASSISSMADAAERPDWTSLEEIDTPLRQCPLSYCIDEAVYNQLLSAAPDTRSRALILSTSLPHAGDWLNVFPSSTLGLHLQDKEFRLCLHCWLGLRMSNEGVTCPVFQVTTDTYGDHQVGCGGNGDRIHRHDSIRDAVLSAAQSAALAPRKEAPSVIPGSSSRPADVYLPNRKKGQPAALDIHVISTYHAVANTSWSFHHSRICSTSGGGEEEDRPCWGLPGCWCHFHPPCRGISGRLDSDH